MFQGNGNFLILHPIGCINIINSSRIQQNTFPLIIFFVKSSTPRIPNGFHFIFSMEPFDHSSSSSTFMYLTRTKVFPLLTFKSLKIKNLIN
jgi:hypothetical protein